MHTPVQKTREELIWEEGVAAELPPMQAAPEANEAEEIETADRMAAEMVDLSALEALNIVLPTGMDLAAFQEAFAATALAETEPEDSIDTAE